MATITFVSDGDPYPALAGAPLTNTGTTEQRLFPGSPNRITEQAHNYTFNYRGGANTSNPHTTTLGAMGIALNGVVIFNPMTGPGPLPGSNVVPPNGFQWDAVYNESSYGVDACGGHPEANGEYHYHSGKFLLNGWMGTSKVEASNTYFSGSSFGTDKFRHANGHSKIVGFAFDGYPIYGPFAYIFATDSAQGTRQMTSSYRTKPIVAEGRVYAYSQYPAGTFIQDYEYVNNLGTLDEYNGRFCHTPDFPTGTYAYFLSFDNGNLTAPAYPYILGPQTKEQRPVGGV